MVTSHVTRLPGTGFRGLQVTSLGTDAQVRLRPTAWWSTEHLRQTTEAFNRERVLRSFHEHVLDVGLAP